MTNPTHNTTTDQPAETPEGRPRKVYKAVRNDQLLLPIPVSPGAVVVPKWDQAHEVPGWVLTAAEIDMHQQSLLWGQLLYTREADGRLVRVGVRWNPQQFGLEAECLDSPQLKPGPALPLTDTDAEGIDTDALELSTLQRAQRLVELNSFIGNLTADPTSQDVILQSAGLGLKRLPDPENWSVAEAADNAPQPGKGGVDAR